MSTLEFEAWPKTPRLFRDMIITEKIDGTNAAVVVYEHEGELFCAAQSRKRIIQPGKDTDNYGFAGWVREHEAELTALGVGHHFGEWYGQGIQRNYGLEERRFALFNPDTENVPACCEVVPVLSRCQGYELNSIVGKVCLSLRLLGSTAVPGFMQPEGLVIYHTAARQTFKVLLEGDDHPKGA